MQAITTLRSVFRLPLVSPRTNKASKVPADSIAWPSSGLRRVSVNSFGFGGSNTHVVLDDALHYLKSRGIVGNHSTVAAPGTTLRYVSNGTTHNTVASLPKLLVWSASDEKAIKRTMEGYESFCADKVWSDPAKLNKLAYTLAARRSHMLWRTFAVITDGLGSQAGQVVPSAKPIRSSSELELAFVFTGQGAQYVDMGWDLIQYPVFDETLRQIDDIYRDLGCEWSIYGE